MKFEFYLDGVRVEKIPPEASARITQRFAKAVNDYYAAHPEEYADVLEEVKKEDK